MVKYMDPDSSVNPEEIYKKLSQEDKKHADSLEGDERTAFLIFKGTGH